LRKAAVIPDEIISSIFGNVRQIMALNQELMMKLEENKGIGGAFLQMAPFFKLYSMYANNHEKALATMMVIKVGCNYVIFYSRFCRSGSNGVRSLELFVGNRRASLK
jgi:hypothetical protein